MTGPSRSHARRRETVDGRGECRRPSNDCTEIAPFVNGAGATDASGRHPVEVRLPAVLGGRQDGCIVDPHRGADARAYANVRSRPLDAHVMAPPSMLTTPTATF